MNLYADFKLLDETLISLAGKDDELRKKAVAEVKAHVESAARELSLERFARFENELYQNIFSYVNGNTLGEKVGGILAIRELISCTSASAEAKVIRFAKALAVALSSCNDFALIELIADALGHMARNSPVSHVEYLEGELHRALDWLKGKNTTHRRYAACIVLQQLAKNAPTIFFVRIHEFFDLIWGPIWDSKERIRFAAGKAFSACLSVLRERTYHLQWYCYLYDQFQEGFHNGNEEYVHGSLLVLQEALRYTGDFMIPRFKEVCKSIMQLKDHKSKLVRAAIISLLPALAVLCSDAFARSHLEETVDFLLKSSKVAELRSQVLLATGKLSVAVGPHLVNYIDQLMSIIRDSFVVGKKGAKASEVAPEALLCISDMVQGLGAPFHERVLALLEPMLQSGLTAELIETLSIISTYMPNQRPMIQNRLLEEATKVLGGDAKPAVEDPEFVYSWAKKGVRLSKAAQVHIAVSNVPTSPTNGGYGGGTAGGASLGNSGINYMSSASLSSMAHSQSSLNLAAQSSKRPVSLPRNNAAVVPAAAPAPSKPPSSGIKKLISGFRGSSSTKAITGSAGVGVAAIVSGGFGAEEEPPLTYKQPNELVLLSLRTLSSLSVPTFNVIPLVQSSVLPYFISDDFRVRREAATTAAKMIIAAMTPPRTRGPSANAIEDIISRILEVTISDISANVRLAVLKSLTMEFDKYLARAHHIDTLLLLLADEMFEIKMEALSVLGRLAASNPATVLPPIRFQLIRMISEMTSCPDRRSIEEATLMLCNFLKYPTFHTMVKPFMQTLIVTLPLRSDVKTTTAALEAMGELSIVLQHEMLPYVDPLLSIIITNMLDHGVFRKQEVAVKTLGQVVRSTGLVVRPYLQYPQLLPKALDMLFRNTANRPHSLRMEIMRTLGLLGALDASKYQQITTCLKNHEKLKRELDEAKQQSERNKNPTVLDASLLIVNSVSEARLSEKGAAASMANRDRADSNISMSDVRASLNSLPKEKEDKRDDKNKIDAKIETEDLLKSEALLEGDKAEAPAHLYMFEQSFMKSLSEPPHSRESTRFTPSSDDYYPRVATASLLKMLRDQSLSVHHSSATQTIIQIFRSLGPKSVPFLDQIVPYFFQIVRRSSAGLRESILQQMAQLVAIAEHNITPFLPSIFEILKDYWAEHLEYVLAIVKQIAITTSDSFSIYLPNVLPLLLSSLSIPRGVTSNSYRLDASLLRPVEQTLSCCRSLRVSLRPYIHLFVPVLCKLITSLQELSPDTLSVQVKAVATLKRLLAGSKGAVMEQYHVVVSVCVHTMTRTIIKASQLNLSHTASIFMECQSTLVTIAQQIGSHILPFDSLILRSIEGRGFDTTPYKDISQAIRSGYWNEMRYSERPETNQNYDDMDGPGMNINRESRSESDLVGMQNSLSGEKLNNEVAPVQKLLLNQQHLQRAWDVSQRSTATDWSEWLWRFKVELLRESPIPTLRACAALAQAHPPMATELFHASFVSCWHELTETYQDHLVRSLQTAFRSTTIPPEILQSLLNLAEFMEHDVEALPISLSILAELAQKGHAYAKALHYRELEFQTNPATCLESLININKKLDQYDAASGLLKLVKQIQKKFPDLKEHYAVQESWLAKLGHWEEALVKYDEKLVLNPKNGEAIAGKMKCLNALGRWEEAIKMCEDNIDSLRMDGDVVYAKAAMNGARAAWSLNEWSLMGTFVNQVPSDNMDGTFMKAVLAVHNENYAESSKYIELTRKHVDTSITALLAESYNRAYAPFVMLQQCSELEEIMEFKILLKEAGMGDNGAVPSAAEPFKNSLAGNYMDNTYRGVGTGMYGGIPRTPTRYESISNHLNSDNPDIYNMESLTAARLAKQFEVQRRKNMLTEKWKKRISGCVSTGRAAIEFWKYLLNGRRMVLSEKEDLDTWLDFVSLCRNGGNTSLAERILSMSQNYSSSSSPSSHPHDTGGGKDDATIIMDRRIRYAVLKQKWAVGDRMKALQGLEALIRGSNNESNSTYNDVSYLNCLLKLGEWKIGILDPSLPVDKNVRKEVLSLYSKATLVDPHSYMAWHQWGLSNYRAVEESRASHLGSKSPVFNLSGVNKSSRRHVHSSTSPTKKSPVPAPLPVESYSYLVINSIKGFTRALNLGLRKFSSHVTQDMLCILSLWFRYGKIPEVCAALESGLSMVHLDNWLGVLPQLIARIDHPDKPSRDLLHNLLSRLGVKHAQALVYPLSVALKSPKGDRKEAAEALMASLRQHSAKIIDQVLLVSQELVRVAILWEELWHWSLEEASRQYFGDGNTQGMLDILVPLHQSLEAGPNTVREATFFQAYGGELSDAWDAIKVYMRMMQESNTPIPTTGANKKSTGAMKPEDSYLHQAWDLYFNVFKRINTALPTITSLDLQSCSPALNNARDMDIGVPGTYSVTGSVVRITQMGSIVAIIRSKQRPRKIRILGEDGQEFIFLLKGHEDLRQDERAMQLFGLVNALLYHDRRTGSDSQDFSIQRYAVIPLSPTAGLISWVPNCDTLHDLIRSYRESRKIMLDVERKLILQVAPNKLYDSLPAMHKLEVFEYALAYTTGEDLAKILWLKSENSEFWLQRRATYTRSLAVMSMVGYILGLGDRHPSNLMLDRQTGKVLHIDFGDCFEVAMHREKFPEKIPFRLTRMLVNAMEVAGIEGNYRSTCEKVMSVLRENRDSLVATLEAFVHDPLISWRLLNTTKANKKSPVSSASTMSSRTALSEGEITSPIAEAAASESTAVQFNNSATAAAAVAPRTNSTASPAVPVAGPPLVAAVPPAVIPASPAPGENGNGSSVQPAKSEITSKFEANEVPVSTEKPPIVLNLKVDIAAANKDVPDAPTYTVPPGTVSILKPSPRDSKSSLSPRIGEASNSGTSSSGRRNSHVSILEPILEKDRSNANAPHDSPHDDDEDRQTPSPNEELLNKDYVQAPPPQAQQQQQVAGSVKTVSFSMVNQTLESNNTIRTSSIVMAINPPPTSPLTMPGGGGANGGNGAAASGVMPMDGSSASATAGPSAGQHRSSSVTASYRANLHLEMNAMANSISCQSPGRHSASMKSVSMRMHENPMNATDHAVSASVANDGSDTDVQIELTEKAVVVIRRVMDKLTGLDFHDGAHSGGHHHHQQGTTPSTALEVPEQVERLIKEATSNENLSLSFFGWCPFW